MSFFLLMKNFNIKKQAKQGGGNNLERVQNSVSIYLPISMTPLSLHWMAMAEVLSIFPIQESHLITFTPSPANFPGHSTLLIHFIGGLPLIPFQFLNIGLAHSLHKVIHIHTHHTSTPSHEYHISLIQPHLKPLTPFTRIPILSSVSFFLSLSPRHTSHASLL